MTPFRDSPLTRPLFDDPIIYVDIGARGGFEAELLPLAFCTDAVGFEPAPDEWLRLQDAPEGPWHSQRILPHAIGGSNAKRRLHVPDDAHAASLLPANPEACAPFGRDLYFDPREIIEVDTLTLPNALDGAGIGEPDYLKIDAEGAEYEILAAADDLVRGLSAIKIEVAFLPLRQGHPVASDLERHLRDRGFQLFDLIGAAHWRDRGNVIHPFVDEGPVPYSRGQVVHGDYLFFRTADSLDFDSDAGRREVLKTAVLAMAFGFFDFALRLLSDRRMTAFVADGGVEDVELMVGQLSAVAGRQAYRRAFAAHLRGVYTYLRRFFQGLG
jgi:FkbM family methyltransferase